MRQLWQRFTNPISPVAAPIPMIRTRYAGPTDRSGSRVVATHVTSRKRKIVSWDHSLDVLENHEHAAKVLLGSIDRSSGRLYHASEDGGGYLWALAPARGR